MFIRYVTTSVFCLFSIFILLPALAVAQQMPPQRQQSDSEEDADLDCFDCSRGDLLTIDLVTGEVTRRTPPEGVPDVLRLMSAGGQGALVPPGDAEVQKDFSTLSEISNTLIGDYPKHVKIYSWYTNEHGQEVASSCSGTMIDPFHVLTAGHCVYKFEDRDGNDVDDWAHTIRVMPAFDNDAEPFGRAYGMSLHSWAGWTESEDYDWDVAVIDLEWPIGALSGWRGYASNPNCSWYTGGYWEHIGYPSEDPYNGKIMYSQSGQFDGCESEGNEVYFDRNMYKGQSGGGSVRDGNLYTVRSNSTLVGVDDWDTYDVRITNTMWYDITGWIDSDTPGTLDLIPLELTVTADIVLGEFFSFDFLLHNYSSVTATGSWPVGVFLSDDTTIDGNDHFLGTVTISGPIGPKQTVSKHIGLNISCATLPWPSFLGVHLNYADANSGNSWTQPRHAVEVETHRQTPPPLPVLSSPPDFSLCRERDDLVLMWSDTAPLGDYRVQLGTSPESGPYYDTTNNYITVSDLLASTWYYWRVAANNDCSDWSGWTEEHQFRTEPNPNTAAAVISPPDSAHCVSTTPTLQWTQLDGAEGYDVRISPNWCYEGDIITDIGALQVTVPDLLPNTTYYWAVRAHNFCGQTTSWSSAGQFCFTFKTAPTAIDPPTWLSPPDGYICGRPNTTLGWDAGSDPDHFEVQVGTSCGTGEIHSVTSSYTVEGVESEVVYNWRVRTFHECGLVSDWSDCSSFSLDLEPPENPATLGSYSHQVGVWSTDNEVQASWDFAWDDCIGSWPQYASLWDQSPTTEPTVVTSSGEGISSTSPLLDDEQNHWFHLRTVDWAGNPAIETMHLGPFWIDATAPSDVVITSVSVPTNLWGDYGELKVDWNPATDGASGIAGYSYVLDQESISVPDATIDTTLETVTLPLQNGMWMFRIAAIDAAGIRGPVTEIGPIWNNPTYPAFLLPVAGQEIVGGEVLQVQWEQLTGINYAGSLHLSLDGGQSFTQIASLPAEEVENGLFPWAVPAETTTEAVLMLTYRISIGPTRVGSAVFSIRAVSDVDEGMPEAAQAAQMAIFPNPFNPRTTISYTLPAETRVRMTVFDALGRRIRTLANWRQQGPGRHEVEWDGTNDHGLGVSSGVYFSCLETPHGRETKRLTLVK